MRIGCGRGESSSWNRIYEGRVVLCDRGEETPVAGSAVFLLGGTASAQRFTAADGSFRFEGLAPGHYLVLLDALTLPGVRREEIGRTLVDLSSGNVLDAIVRIRCDR